jgi:hypothetical protein
MVCRRWRHKTDLHTAKNREKEQEMPLYMDIHENIPAGITTQDVAGAHAADVSVQGKYGVDYRSYWVDEADGQVEKVFCLIDAPNQEAAVAVHKEAHGLLADRIHEVVAGA